MSSALEIKSLSKAYQSGERITNVLIDINFKIESGEQVSIIGPSGSGKTTLLGLCAGLDNFSEGDIILFDDSMKNKSEDELAAMRNEKVGFIFQNFQLLPSQTALENVMIPMELKGMKNIKNRAKELLEEVGLGHRITHYPTQLSGGEQQRVSIARAFANDPKILFADEPTGNLDGETSEKIEDLIFSLNKEKGTTLVLVTHDSELANKTERILKLKSGKLISDEHSEKHFNAAVANES